MEADRPPAADACVYGSPDPMLVETSKGVLQLSPLRPGSAAIETLPAGSVGEMVIAAPPGAVERRYVLALALRALRPGGKLNALAPKDRGGARLSAELAGFGCELSERFKARHRICEAVRPAEPVGLDAAITEGAPLFLEDIGLWSQPGIFSYDRIDPGSALLAQALPELAGRGVDLGAGLGVLARAILRSPRVSTLALVEIDRRAVEASRRNVVDARAEFHWADAREIRLSDMDFVVSNPPFHAEGREDKGLGQRFIAAAAAVLRRGGTFWLVANRHLPYEAALASSFRTVTLRAEAKGFKLLESIR